MVDKAKGGGAGGAVDKAKDVTGDLVGKAKPLVDKAGGVAVSALDKAKDVTGDVVDKAKPLVGKASDAAGGLLDKAKEKLATDKTGDDDDDGTKTRSPTTRGEPARWSAHTSWCRPRSARPRR